MTAHLYLACLVKFLVDINLSWCSIFCCQLF